MNIGETPPNNDSSSDSSSSPESSDSDDSDQAPNVDSNELDRLEMQVGVCY